MERDRDKESERDKERDLRVSSTDPSPINASNFDRDRETERDTDRGIRNKGRERGRDWEREGDEQNWMDPQVR